MLKNRDIFERPIFDVPKRRGNQSVEQFISSQYDEFLDSLHEFKNPVKEMVKPYLGVIKSQCQSINEALHAYLSGSPSMAYSKVKQCLDELTLKTMLPIQTLPRAGGKNLYRLRIASNAALQKQNLFHIPFELREKVSTQRYSIPGLPCLYLADSIFVCWEETGRPDINQIQVSRFDLSQGNFKFLYFNVNTNDIRRRCFATDVNGKFINQLVSYLNYWPLLMACSLAVQKDQDVFKPEYIVPQLVLQWVVSENRLDGVQYKSNRIRVGSHSIGSFTNIVIPVKILNHSGYCQELSQKIRLTNPISWQLLDISNNNRSPSFNSDYKISDLRRAMYVEFIEGEKSIYIDSKFGIMEEKLKSMHATVLE
jgi:hypothetical protein